MSIDKAKTVKLCEESQMTLAEWHDIWKKEYADKVIDTLDKIGLLCCLGENDLKMVCEIIRNGGAE